MSEATNKKFQTEEMELIFLFLVLGTTGKEDYHGQVEDVYGPIGIYSAKLDWGKM